MRSDGENNNLKELKIQNENNKTENVFKQNGSQNREKPKLR